MPPYLRLGSIPPKRHIAHRREGGYRGEGIYYEEVVTTAGFGRAYSICYHLRPPTRVRKVEAAGALDLGVVDEPALPGLVPPVTHVTNGVGYVRFHGRNAKHWWGSPSRAATVVRDAAPPGAPARGARGSGDQLRYDYNYSEKELTDWIAKINELARQAKQTYLFFNNCHAGQAARNAKLMEELLRRSNPLL